jgi:amino acid transporter
MSVHVNTQTVSRWLFGPPLQSQEAPQQTVSKTVGLAVFASDALSSVAYATQEILVVLIVAGTGALAISMPISLAIAALLVILTISYRQTIAAYPGGGGAYIVARDNLGEVPAQVAAAALLIDYTLTVAVSISSGVEHLASAIPALLPYTVEFAVALVMLMMVINLRGVKESGRIFAIPTYFFVGMMFLTLAIGLVQLATGTLSQVTFVETLQHVPEQLTLLLVLRAFSSGCTALTGVEAISNGIPSFKEPKTRNAAATLTVMACILGVMFLGTTLLANYTGAMPSATETVISQISRTILGRGILYALVIASATVILVMAANTSYAGFPRLAAMAAGDGFLPRQLTFKSSRLVFKWGIVVLAGTASLLVIVFNASVSGLIPLYAIGVFLSFSLSQLGMVVRWHRISKLKPGEESNAEHSVLRYDPRWRIKQISNAVGAVVTITVTMVFAYTKFPEGAWVTVIIIPSLVLVFSRIRAHYISVAKALSLRNVPVFKLCVRPMRTVILVDDVHRGTLRLVEFAKSLGNPWVAVHVDYNDRGAEQMQLKWQERIGEGELVVLPSPYRHLIEPVRDFVLSERDKIPGGFVHVIMGQLVMTNQVQRALHSNNALGIMGDLQRFDRIVVTDVPYQLYPHSNGYGNGVHVATETPAQVNKQDFPFPTPALTPAPPPKEIAAPVNAAAPQADPDVTKQKDEE